MRQRMRVTVKVPDGAQNEAVALVVHARSAVSAKVEGILNHFGVISGEGDYRRGVGIIVNDFSIGIGSKQLIILRESLVELEGQSVVDGIGAALEFRDARKAWDRTNGIEHVDCESLRSSHKANGSRSLRALQIYVTGARQMCSLDPEVVDLDGHGGLNLILQSQVGLLHIGLVIVRLENKDRGNASCHPRGGWTARSRRRSA